MNEEKKPADEVQAENGVKLNTDPAAGPLDGASAIVNVIKTRFGKNGEISQKKLVGGLKASYSLGVVSISIPGEKLMLTVRVDEMMQVMYTSAAAYNEQRRKEESKEEGNDD